MAAHKQGVVSMFRPITLTVIAAIGMATHVSTARAEVQKLVPIASVRVNYSDLDIQNENDARLLLERIDRAAYKACGGDPRWHPQYRQIPRRVNQTYLECRQAAVSRAVAEVDVRELWVAFANAGGRKSDEAPRAGRS
jgi:UrcA family protein